MPFSGTFLNLTEAGPVRSEPEIVVVLSEVFFSISLAHERKTNAFGFKMFDLLFWCAPRFLFLFVKFAHGLIIRLKAYAGERLP